MLVLFVNNIVMNRLLALLAVAVIVALLMLAPTDIVDMLPAEAVSNITIYCHGSTLSSVYNGILYEVSCSADNYHQTISCCSGIEGIAVVVDNSQCSLQQLLDYLDISNTVDVSGYSSHMYGYYAKLGNSIVIDGNLVNVHIVSTDNAFVVGTPILLGSY